MFALHAKSQSVYTKKRQNLFKNLLSHENYHFFKKKSRFLHFYKKKLKIT